MSLIQKEEGGGEQRAEGGCPPPPVICNATLYQIRDSSFNSQVYFLQKMWMGGGLSKYVYFC